MEALVPVVLALLAGLGLGSVRVTSSSRSMLVERLGKYNRQLSPGLSLVLPGIERVVSHESLKERVLDIPPQQCITRDNVSIQVDAVVYWQLLEHSRAYYAVDNLQAAMVNVVLTQIRAEMGKLDLDQTFTTRSEINDVLLRELDQATDPWGVKVTRVELRDIQPSQGVQQAMEQQMTAEREKRASILRSEGERESQVNAARGRAEALVLDAKAKQEALLLEADAQAKQQGLLARARADAATQLAQAIEAHPAAAESLRLLLAKDWIAMGEQLSKAPGGSVLLVDPQSPAALLTALRGCWARRTRAQSMGWRRSGRSNRQGRQHACAIEEGAAEQRRGPAKGTQQGLIRHVGADVHESQQGMGQGNRCGPGSRNPHQQAEQNGRSMEHEGFEAILMGPTGPLAPGGKALKHRPGGGDVGHREIGLGAGRP